MKKLACLSMAVVAGALFCAAPVQKAFAEERPVNLFESERDWDISTGQIKNLVKFEDGQLEITPIDTTGATYTAVSMGQGKISFTYQLEYADGVVPFTADTPEYQCFFGLTFLNSPGGIVVPTGELAVPWNYVGGYPYMVCFDTELQGKETNRVKQVGLTLRRYKAAGSHDYTRWSSVEPTEEIFHNNAGAEYESKIPAFSRPVTLDECFNTEEHAVDIEVKNLSVSKGDEKDAVQIDVTFDGELSLTVIDEMPFEGEELGDVIDVDKRDENGWISFYAFNGFNKSDLDMWDYKIHIKSCTAVFGDDNGNPSKKPASDKGCNGSVTGSAVGIGAAAFVAAAGAAVVLNKKKNAEK